MLMTRDLPLWLLQRVKFPIAALLASKPELLKTTIVVGPLRVLLPLSDSWVRRTLSAAAVHVNELSPSRNMIQPFCQLPVQLVPVLDAQTPTFPACLIASLLARLMSAMNSLPWVVNRFDRTNVLIFGATIPRRIPTMVKVMTNSITEKPLISLLCETNGIFKGIIGSTNGSLKQTNGNLWKNMERPSCCVAILLCLSIFFEVQPKANEVFN